MVLVCDNCVHACRAFSGDMALDPEGLLCGGLTRYLARRIAAAAGAALPRFPHAPPALALPPLGDAGRGGLAGVFTGAAAFGADVPSRCLPWQPVYFPAVLTCLPAFA